MADDDVIPDPPGDEGDTSGRNAPVVLRMEDGPADAAAVFAPGDALTVVHVTDIATRYDAALAAAGRITVDLAEVGDCDTAGMQLLIAMRRRAAALDKEFVFQAPSAAVIAAARCIGVDLAAIIGE